MGVALYVLLGGGGCGSVGEEVCVYVKFLYNV